MDKHICKRCGKVFNYCRTCVFKPIGYHESGFCSEECRTKFRLAEKIEISSENEEIHE